MITDKDKETYRSMSKPKIREFFRQAYLSDNVELIIFLVKDQAIAKKINMRINNDAPLFFACDCQNLDLINHYLYEPLGVKNPTLENTLITSCNMGLRDTVAFLFQNFEITMTPEIKRALKESDILYYHPVEESLKLHTLNKELNNSLEQKEVEFKKAKL